MTRTPSTLSSPPYLSASGPGFGGKRYFDGRLGPSTNWEDAFKKVDTLAVPNLVVLVTDGDPNTVGNGPGGNAFGTAVPPAKVVANQIKSEGTHILALGLGGFVGINNLREVSDGANSTTLAIGSNNAGIADTFTGSFGMLSAAYGEIPGTVCPSNTPPVANDDAYTTDEDTTLIVVAPGALSNDTDADGDALIAELLTPPLHGSETFNINGAFEYAPFAGYFGTDSFTYRVSDGTDDSNVATVTITVNKVNVAPVAVDDAYATEEDTRLTVPASGVLGNDTDDDGDALTAVPDSGPGNGTLTLNANGSFDYTPNAGFFGTDSFTYHANDGSDDSNVAAVTITVVIRDSDGDTIRDADDNCPFDINLDQADLDGDGQGNVCDTDDDNDGVLDTMDNCPFTVNPDQLDVDGVGIGNSCDLDNDNDGVPDVEDECPSSDLSASIVIDGCDSGVENSLDVLGAIGCSVSDLVGQIAETSPNHGRFVSGVAHLTNSMKKAGVISENEKGAIQSCAGNANIP